MNTYAQESKLRLKTKIGANGKCVIEDNFFTPPFKLMAPFYPKDDLAEIMLLAVSPGMMKGDAQDMQLNIGQNCKLRITSQSFEKIHNTEDGFASRNMNIEVEENAFLDFAPFPLIPFENAHFKGNTTISLHSSSQLLYSEIIVAGRVARDELFQFNRLHTKISVLQANRPIYYDNTILDPKTTDMKNMCMFDSYTHYLNLILINCPIDLLSVRTLIEESQTTNGVDGAVSEIASSHLCVKALASGSEALLDLREKIARLITQKI
ncbi:urease accessory protein UreD [Helicobacter cetorum]|uniref:Urease accessory protein UreD n=1 Tax=Helicobacter cetorum (strain ATCC BAA-540 / CCUG 52418 / MIT 99-5656) TaxID=1163745 RepID=I0ES19_HELCM|nr:urease accessory protein UreD [Helicobacter cetorum]AFI05738.1 urease accessory protein UreD [Helicobacter cetorum MIT 99-5656]